MIRGRVAVVSMFVVSDGDEDDPSRPRFILRCKCGARSPAVTQAPAGWKFERRNVKDLPALTGLHDDNLFAVVPVCEVCSMPGGRR